MTWVDKLGWRQQIYEDVECTQESSTQPMVLTKDGSVGRELLASHWSIHQDTLATVATDISGSFPSMMMMCICWSWREMAKLLFVNDIFNTAHDPLMDADSSTRLLYSL